MSVLLRPAFRASRLVLACGLMAAGAWAVVRGEALPGTEAPLWALPLWTKGVVWGGCVALSYALLWFGRRCVVDAAALYDVRPAVRLSTVTVRWYRYLNPIGLLYNLYLHRQLLRQFVRREVEGRYRGSSLGIIWSLITPLFMLAIYTFAFSVIFKARWRTDGAVNHGEFAIILFAGLIAFNLFTECVNRAPTLIVSNPNYVKKVVFPLEILPVSALGAALFHALVSVAILIPGQLLIMGTISETVVLVPLVMIPLIALSLGLTWFLAALGVYLRDIAHAVGIITQVLFFVTPLFYPIESAPEVLRRVLSLNPLYQVVESFRRVIIWNRVPDWGAWLVVAAVSGLVMLLGYAWFMKTKTGFADVI